MNPKIDQLVRQLDCMTPTEKRRLAKAVEIGFCAKPKGIPNIVEMLGYVGLLMSFQMEADWEAEKRLPITEPAAPAPKEGL